MIIHDFDDFKFLCYQYLSVLLYLHVQRLHAAQNIMLSTS